MIGPLLRGGVYAPYSAGTSGEMPPSQRGASSTWTTFLQNWNSWSELHRR